MPDFGSAGAALSVASGVKSLFGGSKTAGAAGAAGDAAIIAAQTQAEVAAKQEARNDEQWARFKQKYYPLEDQLLDPAFRNVQERGELAATEAGDAVSTSFAAQRGQANRALERAGVNPADGKFRALNRTADIAEAAMRADSMNDARVAERQRVEDTNFNRALQVMSLGRGMPAQVSGGTAQASAAYGNNASIYSNLAKMLAQDAGSAASGGMQAITRGMEALGKSPIFNSGGSNMSTDADVQGGEDFYGNPVTYREGGPVVGPTHEGGGVDIEAEGGEYVLPNDVVRYIGMEKIESMVSKAKQAIATRGQAPRAIRREQ